MYPTAVAVRSDFTRVGRIGGLSLGSFQVLPADLLSHEPAIQLLDLRHQVGIKPSDLDARIPEAEFPAATDRVVRIEHADNDASDPAFDNSFHAWKLGTVSRRARLQRRKEGRTRQRIASEPGLQKRELGVVSGSEFASEGLAQRHTIPRDNGSDLGRDTSLFAHAPPRERYGPLHKRSLRLQSEVVDGHSSGVVALAVDFDRIILPVIHIEKPVANADRAAAHSRGVPHRMPRRSTTRAQSWLARRLSDAPLTWAATDRMTHTL